MKRAALGLLVALAVVILGPAPAALAHTELILSTPEDGAVLETVPEEIVLTFSEDLIPDTVVVSVEDSTGMAIRLLTLQIDGSDVTAPWPAGLTGTEYAINYRVVSQDGHPVSGSLAFTVTSPPSAAPGPSAPPIGSPAATAPTAPAPPVAAASDSTSKAPLIAIAAGLGVGIAVGFGYLLFRRGRSS